MKSYFSVFSPRTRALEAVQVMNQVKEVKSYLRNVFQQCVNAMAPGALVRKELIVTREKDTDYLTVRDVRVKLSQNVYLVGFGKGVLEMARESEATLRHHLKRGIVSVPHGLSEAVSPPKSVVEVYHGAKNNLPDEDAKKTAHLISNLVKPLTADDLLLVLVSGGGSALLPCPAPPVLLSEKLAVTELLAKAGANIVELNAVRKCISLLKGGKLAQLAHPATVIALILSDVIGDPLDAIAGGPSVPDAASPSLATEVLKKYNLTEVVPRNVIEILNGPTPTEVIPSKKLHNFIIGNNKLALEVGNESIKNDGVVNEIVTTCLQGSVDKVAPALAKLATIICQTMGRTTNRELTAQEVSLVEKTLCFTPGAVKSLASKLDSHPVDKLTLLFGGETTVLVKGNGLGGRNQELALRFSKELDELTKTAPIVRLFSVVLLSSGTDGMDGPTDAAGAFGYGGLVEEAERSGLNVDEALKNNDSYNFYNVYNNGEDHIKTGPTGTNVMDIVILLIQSKI